MFNGNALRGWRGVFWNPTATRVFIVIDTIKTGAANASVKLALAILISILLPAQAANVGVQAIGLRRWKNESVTNLAGVYRDRLNDETGQRLEISHLPFGFAKKGDNPFAKMDIFIDEAFKNNDIKGVLTISTYLWFHGNEYYLQANDSQKSVHGGGVWFYWDVMSSPPVFNGVRIDSEATNRQLSDTDSNRLRSKRLFLREYGRRLEAFDDWVLSVNSRLSSNNVSHLRFVFCPFLEDNCASGNDGKASYNAVNKWCFQVMTNAGINTSAATSAHISFRRCASSTKVYYLSDVTHKSKFYEMLNIFRAGDLPDQTKVGLEIHGTLSHDNDEWTAQKDYKIDDTLHTQTVSIPWKSGSGDVFSNDGNRLDVTKTDTDTIAIPLKSGGVKSCSGANAPAVTEADFKTDAKALADSGVTTLIWRAAYNR